ncbi:hypothetical protein XOC_4490 [Xanthomonas oryzae pv. oryzicola BLS256]|uniref:Uncharacterized protein n=1 Tax=Xanthomonas oryzae pv. oryzicola (strain BLS256) TaxID=383407 RepID=G7TAG0_XANOB|nr:hypothetical protein XOC_4490 [Xanthomonas oryzae pv. oryzicola BLS256]QEO95227.1 hypothetical protein XOCgx_0232 [Xanthomonas oryzae pv. oryzicola]
MSGSSVLVSTPLGRGWQPARACMIGGILEAARHRGSGD